MSTFSVIVRRTALVLTSLFAGGGLLFALGYAFDDPGGWVAFALTLAVLVPLLALTWLAIRVPALALRVLAGGVVLLAAYGALSLFVDLVDAPVVPVAALVLALPIAVAGQRYASAAGGIMAALAGVPFVLVVIRMFQETTETEGPGMRDLLGGSTGVVVLPLAFLAALLLVAGVSGRAERPPEAPRVEPPQPAQQA